jgi:hypothetical protein
MMRLRKQIRAAALTYMSRPAFVIIVAIGLAGLAATYALSRAEEYQPAMRWSAPAVFVFMLLLLSPSIMLLAFVIVFVVHVRDQLRGPHGALVPGFRPAHLIVAGAIFFAIVLGLTILFHRFDDNPKSFVGVFAIVLTIMTLAMLSGVGSPWWLIGLVAAITLVLDEHVWRYLYVVVCDYSRLWEWAAQSPSLRPGEWYSRLRFEENLAWSIRATILALNAAALGWIALRAKPRTGPSASARLSDRLAQIRIGRRSLAQGPHRPVTTVLARGWHRRFAVHTHHVAWNLAAGLAVVMALMFLLLPHDQRHSSALLPLAMATIIPAAAVGIGWRERWPSLSYECLYPAGRAEFVNEMVVAIAADLAEFWLAATIAGLVVLAIWEPHTLLLPRFLASLTASALMQILAFGVTFLLVRFRAWPLYVVAMLLLLEATFVPLMQTWRDQRPSTPTMLLTVAVVEAALGILLAAVGRLAWGRAEFA